jgi:hypothetical protein
MSLALTLWAIAMLLGQNGTNHDPGRLDPNDVLQRARAKIQALTRRLESYTCVETVDRQYFQPVATAPPVAQAAARSCRLAGVPRGKTAALRLESSDRLRFEVTVADSREILSRPGAARFDPRDVDSIVRFGPIGTGSFGSYLIGVFDNPSAVFRYSGQATLDHRAMLEYQYDVPVEASRYRVKAGASWLPMAYHGSFLIDPESLDLERFLIRADDLPPQTSICEAETTLDYSGVRIRVGDALLPRDSRLQVVMQNGRETLNTTTFSSCREYHAESSLVFEETPDAESSAARPVFRAPAALPIGLPVTLALSAAIDTDTAAAGDVVSAEVVGNVSRPGPSDILIPAGATVHGRITRVEHHVLPKAYFLIAMSFNRLEVSGSPAPFAARLDPKPNVAEELGADLSAAATTFSGGTSWNTGTFLFITKNSRYVLPAGYQSTWSTLATPGR